MKIKDDLVGRDVLDATGHKIGEVDDVDVDFDNERISAIILHEGGILRSKDKIIPYNMVEAVGERVILKKETGRRMEGDEGEERENYVEERDVGRGRDKPDIRERDEY